MRYLLQPLSDLLSPLLDWLQSSWLGAGLVLLERSGMVTITHGLLGLTYVGIALALVGLLLFRRNTPSVLTMVMLVVLFLLGGGAHGLAILAAGTPGSGLLEPLQAGTGLVALIGALMLLRLLPDALTLPRPAKLVHEVGVRRAAEVRARISEAQLTDLFHHLPDSLFVVRLQPDGNFVFENVNTAFRRLVNHPDAELIGSRASGFMPPAAASMLERQFGEALGSSSVTEHEAAVQATEGHRIWHTLLVPLRSEGADVRLLGSIRDVTTIRRLRSDLQEASRLATVGSMCAGVAHEMSQPINVVSLWSARARAALSREQPDMRRLRRSLEIVDEQTKRLGTLLERMRDLTDESNDELDTFDAGAAAHGAVEMVGRNFALKGVSVILAPRREALPVRARRAQLEQALLQIVANAADAVERRRQIDPQAPSQVRVSLHADPASAEAVIEVRDTGGGVPAALQERIFDPFFTTKDPGQGTGLGLAIAQGAARAMGGSLTTFNVAQGSPDAGAVFRLSLPLVTQRTLHVRKIA